MEINSRLNIESYNGCCIGHSTNTESFLKAAPENCDATLCAPCTATDIKVMLDDSRESGTELRDTILNCSAADVSNNKELEPCVEASASHFTELKSFSGMSHLTELKSFSGMKLEGACNLTESEAYPVDDPSMTGSRRESLTKYNATEASEKHCMKNLAEEAPHDAEFEAKGFTEIEPCTESHPMELIDAGNCREFAGNNHLGKARGSFCMKLPTKDEVKDGFNDDIQSEFSNPNQSPKNIHSSMTTTSQPLDVPGGDHGTCGEITSSCFLNTFVDDSLVDEESTECKVETVSMDCVVLEIPKHVRPTGIRKITFKFNKRKNDYDKELSVPVEPLIDDKLYEDFYKKQIVVSSAECLTSNDVDNLDFNDSENVDMDLSQERMEFHDVGSSFSCVSNKELKMSKKIVPDDYPTKVKKLLSSGILEGARVKYISATGEKEIPGIIKDGGYLCGCWMCSYSKVVGAHEFELHAGTKTKHPNNHVYLENGKDIYSIIQELRAAPLSTVDGVLKSSVGSSINEEYFQIWKANLQNGTDIASTDTMHHCYPASFHYPLVDRYAEPPVEQKRLIKKQRHNFCSSFYEHKKAAEGGSKKRDNDLHKLLFMPNGLPDGTSLAYCSKGKRILGGYKQGYGIVCSCCNKEISPSQFEAHAGWAAKRQPYRHIYTSSGLTLHDIALMLANGQSITSTGSDDMCAICGGGGELVICNGCPRAFHRACLGLQSLPADGWHCSHCRDKFCSGRKAFGESKPLVIRLKRVVKAPEFEPGGCIICRSQDFSAADFDDRTVIICDQCEKEYHVGCLRESGICDLKELPEDKWFCCEGCHKIFETLQSMAGGGPELIPAPVSAKLNKKQAEICLSNGSKNEIQWCILSGKSRSPEHLLLLTRAAAIFRERFDPIVAKSGRDLIPVMVYGRNISGQEFSGMYCVVLIANSFVVSAALLRIFGQEVAELPLVATTRDNQGKGYFQAIFSCIEKLLSSMGVKNLVLPAAEEAEPMWMNKLGFRKTNHEQMLKYTSVHQLTIFKGTSLLEKEVENVVD